MHTTLYSTIAITMLGLALAVPADAQSNGAQSPQTHSYAPVPAAGTSTGPVHGPNTQPSARLQSGASPSLSTQSFAPPPVPVTPPPPPNPVPAPR